jgi:hypothetical protein
MNEAGWLSLKSAYSLWEVMRKKSMIAVIGPLFCFALAFVLSGCGAGKPEAGLSDDVRWLRERLLAQGFKPDPGGSYDLILAHARLSDAARLLEMSPADLKPTLSQSWDSDIRTATIGALYVLVYSEVRDNEGRIVSGSLDHPEAVCTVRVVFLPASRVGR